MLSYCFKAKIQSATSSLPAREVTALHGMSKSWRDREGSWAEYRVLGAGYHFIPDKHLHDSRNMVHALAELSVSWTMSTAVLPLPRLWKRTNAFVDSCFDALQCDSKQRYRGALCFIAAGTGTRIALASIPGV